MPGPTTEHLNADIKELRDDIAGVKDQIHGLRDVLKEEIHKFRDALAPEVAKIGAELKTLTSDFPAVRSDLAAIGADMKRLMTEFPPLRNDFIALKSRFDLLLAQVRWIVCILVVNLLGLVGSSYYTVWQASRLVSNVENNTAQIKELSDSFKQLSDSLIANQRGSQQNRDEMLEKRVRDSRTR